MGYKLYCPQLRQRIARLKGEETVPAIRSSVNLDQGESQAESIQRHKGGYTALNDDKSSTLFCEPIQARIPTSYLEETLLCLDFYRRLAM